MHITDYENVSFVYVIFFNKYKTNYICKGTELAGNLS